MNTLVKRIGMVAAVLVTGRVVLAAPASITQTEADAYVRSFYHDMEGGDLEKIMTHFDPTVQWYNFGSKVQAFIADALQQYCTEYPSRSFSIGAVKLKPLANSDGVTVNFDLRFFLRNPARDENSSGSSHVEWDLVKHDGIIKITRFSGTSATKPAAKP